ncbi:hypothetical protein GCM10010275_65560 [Streptomyces litmocidini]|nr:hypothetical protein GCM10010275_65560 [Streptomyces litmocidini]
MAVERHLLETLLAGNNKASVTALATLRSGATHWAADRAPPPESSSTGFGACARADSNPSGRNERCGLLHEHGRPVRTGLVDAADRTWTTPLLLTEDGGTLVACADWPPPPPVTGKPPLQEGGWCSCALFSTPLGLAASRRASTQCGIRLSPF